MFFRLYSSMLFIGRSSEENRAKNYGKVYICTCSSVGPSLSKGRAWSHRPEWFAHEKSSLCFVQLGGIDTVELDGG